MKKIILSTSLAFFTIIYFIGCAKVTPPIYEELQIYEEPQKYCEEILSCLEKKDEKSLKSMFCQTIIFNSSTLDDEIKNAINFFDGDIISYQNPLYPSTESFRDGKLVEYSVSPSIHDIKTSSNNIYNIKFYFKVVSIDNPDKLGISEILITDEDGNECQIGDFYIVNPEYK